ncbi:GGDEF domain-containing protein [Zobellella aerophila]|uniref:diguanylate cyclase n=1 Tax=Zobellella aerophila TaxID=870480 RepID=A0ABP6VCZ1_9GAMM
MELKEYWSDRYHSRDFKLTRVGVVAIRFRWLVTLLIIGIAGWIPMDWLVLDSAHFNLLWKTRLITGAMLTPLLPLSYLCKLNRRWMVASIYYLVGVMLAFNWVALWSFQGEAVPVGYLAFPYFLLGLLGVLPLQLQSSIKLALTISLLVLASDYWLDHGSLTNGVLVDRVWLLLSFGLAMVWVQCGQLRMLLDLYRESSRDPLTRLMNRRLFVRQLEQVRYQSKDERPYSLLLLDLDRFKRINDDFGHLMGDEVLVTVANTILDILGQDAMVARYGGEEFMVLLPDTSLSQALRQAETLRLAVESQPVVSPLDDREVNVTISVGVVEGNKDSQVQALLRQADEALYAAKSRGRNCVMPERLAA